MQFWKLENRTRILTSVVRQSKAIYSDSQAWILNILENRKDRYLGVQVKKRVYIYIYICRSLIEILKSKEAHIELEAQFPHRFTCLCVCVCVCLKMMCTRQRERRGDVLATIKRYSTRSFLEIFFFIFFDVSNWKPRLIVFLSFLENDFAPNKSLPHARNLIPATFAPFFFCLSLSFSSSLLSLRSREMLHTFHFLAVLHSRIFLASRENFFTKSRASYFFFRFHENFSLLLLLLLLLIWIRF